MESNFVSKLPLFEILIVNGDNRIRIDVPYGGLENIIRSVLFYGNKVEVLGIGFRNIDDSL